MTTECPTCGRDDFKSEQGMKMHHSRTHGESIAGVKVTCEACGIEYRQRPCREERTAYCSRECKSNRVTLRCKLCNEEYEVMRCRSDSTFCSTDCMDKHKELIVGEEHPLYDGGPSDKYKRSGWTTFSNRYKSWVGSCEYCGSDKNLHLHHTEPMSMGGDFWDNQFMVLCKDCHFGNYVEWHPPQLEKYI